MRWPGRARNRDEHRYYLLPGMGRSNKRRRAYFFRVAFVVGLLVSLLIALWLYAMDNMGR